MKKLLLIIPILSFFLFINTNYTSATNSLDVIDDYYLDNNIILNEDYQEGYRKGYEDGFNHKSRIKIALWQHNNIQLTVLDTVYRYRFVDFVETYGIFSPQGLTTNQIKNKVFIPTFEGYVGSFYTNVRQWYLGTVVFELYLYVEKPIIESIMTRDNVNEITAFKIYLEENNIYGYFERASGLTDYQIGYNTGYNEGFKSAMKDTTTNLISSILILISPVLLISVILQMLNKFKNDN